MNELKDVRLANRALLDQLDKANDKNIELQRHVDKLQGAIKRAIDICEFEKLESATSLKAGIYQIRLILEKPLKWRNLWVKK